MIGLKRSHLAVLAFALTLAASTIGPAPATAKISAGGTLCTLTGWINGLAGKACNAGRKVVGIGEKLLGASHTAAKAAFMTGVGVWVLLGAKSMLQRLSTALTDTAAPKLTSSWFSGTYWRMAAIAALLTLPFLFAAALQALVRSDLALLGHSAFISLPLAMLVIGIAAPLTMLLLAATDELCGVISAAAGNAGVKGLLHDGSTLGGLGTLAASSFVAFLVGLVTTAGALVVWLEMVMREAAVYIVVMMLPLAFAAFVWPARRIWAVRTIELLVALILSKFAIVAVLALGGAALSASWLNGVSGMIAGAVLVLLAAFAPWAVVRLVPLAELASSAAGSLRPSSVRLESAGGGVIDAADRLLGEGDEVRLGREAEAAERASARYAAAMGGSSDSAAGPVASDGLDAGAVAGHDFGAGPATGAGGEPDPGPAPAPSGGADPLMPPDAAPPASSETPAASGTPSEMSGATAWSSPRGPLPPVFDAEELPPLEVGFFEGFGAPLGESSAAPPADDSDPLPPPEDPRDGRL